MQRTISTQLDATAQEVFSVLSDLGTYVHWLDIVTQVEPAERAPADAGPAWNVTLRAKVGPLARSKRLRMVLTQTDEPTYLRYERAELDDRSHSPWLLEARILGDSSCDVTIDLHYEGRLWTAPLAAILGSEADDAVPRLQALVTGR